MSRSDIPQSPPGGWPAQRPQGDFDPTAWTQGLGGAPRPNPKPQSPAYQPAGHQQPAPAAYQPQQGYAQPQQGYAAQPGQAAPAGAFGGHQDQDYYWGNAPQAGATPAPQFDPYLQQSAPSQRTAPPAQGYGQAPAYAPEHQPASYRHSQPTSYSQGHQQPDLRGAQYDQWASAPAPADPRGYDLSSYMPPQTRTGAGRGMEQQDYGQLQADLHAPQQEYSDWGHQSADYGHSAHSDAAYQAGYDQQQYDDPGSLEHGEYEEDAGYEFEQPPRRSNKAMLIAASLVGAILVGGGLTYAYQSILGSGGDGPTPVVKSAEGPSKVKPSEPGGKKFAHSDSKLLGRLSDNSGSSEPDASGSRKVSTLVVGRDGSIQPPTGEAAPAVSVPVPGLTLVDVPTPGQASASAPVVVTPPPPQSKPVEMASLEDKSTSSEVITPKTINKAESSAPPPVAEAPKPVVKTAAIPQQAPAATAPAKITPKPSGLGYVAVLASVPVSGSSRIDALQQFADMQQKYGGILQNKTPDVQEANLGAKGTYHRLIVGPPGSREGANSVCSQLKSAGYAGCWVTAY